MSAPSLFAVMGPTASGKSKLAESLAAHFEARIINADAFQVYRGMDIGTAKPIERQNYDLLDIRNPDEDFGVGEYVVMAAKLLHTYFLEGRNVVICGGTGLYIRALLEEYKDLMPSPDPELRKKLAGISLDDAVRDLLHIAPIIAQSVDLKNEVRVKRALERQLSDQVPIQFSVPAFTVRKVAIIPTSELSSAKIKQRTKEMFQNGWVTEVKTLLDNGYKSGNPGFRALGYEAIAEYIQESGNEEGLIERIEGDTVKYAKRQRTWLRAEPNLVVYSEVSEALESTVTLFSK